MTATLSNQTIFRLINGDPPLITSYLSLEEQIQPNGFDVTLNRVYTLDTPGTIGNRSDDRKVSETSLLEFDKEDWLHLPQGSFLLTFNEIVSLPLNLMALARPRSSLLRSGVSIHTAVWDAGYNGRSQALINIYNAAGYYIQKNARVMQLVFMVLDAPTQQKYDGAYQDENI